MTTESKDLSEQSTQHKPDRKELDLSLCYAYPTIIQDGNIESVLTTEKRIPKHSSNREALAEDGLYASENLFTRNVVKPYILDTKLFDYVSKPKLCGKLLEIAIRDVIIQSMVNEASSNLQISSVSILFKKKVICKANAPFNKKLHKLLIRNSECSNLLIQVHMQGGHSSLLPLLLPKRCVKDIKVEIDFGITDDSGRTHSGTVICTMSLTNCGSQQQKDNTAYLYKLSNDPNDPHNCLSLLRPKKPIRKTHVKYFLLEDPILRLTVDEETRISRRLQQEETRQPDIAVTEESTFSLLDISFRNLFQARRPLRPSSGIRRHHTIGKALLTVTVLRGVEVPLREESATVQPFVEIEWGNIVHATLVAEGPAPIWQQTMQFELPRQSNENSVKLRLYDQHPVWGEQWLGEARIPLEYHRNYQELERWIALSPIYSPVLLFGYVQASPGHSYTRIYILMKMEQPGNAKSVEDSTIGTLMKGIQRCLSVPYKINGIDNPEKAAKLAMLLPPLPVHYGPLTPRQALNLNKVDQYGRATLLATLLQGLGLHVYVLLGSSQTSKWSAFVLVSEETENTLWDPEIGDHYNLSDSRCSLTKVSRLINHCGVWENLQKSIVPHNLKYDTKSSKDWRPLGLTVSSTNHRSVQTLDVTISVEEEQQKKEFAVQIEEHLREKLAQWRSTLGLTTIFNRHAMNVLRNFVSKIKDSASQQLERKDFKHLYRAYYTHGFILNLRQASLEDLTEHLESTKVHNISGPIEFGLACHVQRYIGRTCSIWLAFVVLRSRD